MYGEAVRRDSRRRGYRSVAAGSMLAVAVGLLVTSAVRADPPDSLKTVPVELPPNLADFVQDTDAALALGKAFFWDVQVGSDAQVACATCHFHAGVDVRTDDATVHPGPNGVIDAQLPLDTGDFPFQHDDRVGSVGVGSRAFNAVVPGSIFDDCDGAIEPRQVTGRNAPPVINAIFNDFNFWDGRAHRVFNGADPTGRMSPARVWVKNDAGNLVERKARLRPASTGSQATGPPNSDVEMACLGRTFQDIGKKMLAEGIVPLGQQQVHPNDSVLGPLSNFPANGIATTYCDLIDVAFVERYASDMVVPDGSGCTHKEANFALYWGISILIYESTLVSDDSPFDRFREGRRSLAPRQVRGMELFFGEARCDKCHGGPETTAASLENGGSRDFTNTGVRPIAEDPGQLPEAVAEFKAPHLRNIELTGPYFHNGGYLTLRQVVNFYNRGGDHPGDEADSQVRPLELTPSQERDLVAFLLSFTDRRVQFKRAPFDHPSIDIPYGPSLPAVGARGMAEPIQPYLWNGRRNFHFQRNPEP